MRDIKPQTRADYRRHWRLHVAPYPLAAMPLAELTGQRLTAHYRTLEKTGRKISRGGIKVGDGLSAATVRHVHILIHCVLRRAVRDNLLIRNPADTAEPPSAQEAKAPEMHPWTAAQLTAFLSWAEGNSQNHAVWHLLAMTGMRRGEVLGLRWQDVNLGAGKISIRRTAVRVQKFRERSAVTENGTKGGKPRFIDLDAGTVTALRAWRNARGAMALHLIADGSIVFGTPEGEHRSLGAISFQFKREVKRCHKALGDAVPVIRLHDLRHTHATLLLLGGIPVHVVSERIGHSTSVITLETYAHVMPGSGREAAETFGRLIREANGA